MIRAPIVFAWLAVSAGPATGQQLPLKSEVEALDKAMVAAHKAAPASVARFYTEDASIIDGGGRWTGRAQIEQYWASLNFVSWTLEAIEVGESGSSVWPRGISEITGASGRTQRTEFLSVLKRQANGELKYYIDMFVAAPRREGTPER